MIIAIISVLAGLILLIYSADRFVTGAVMLAEIYQLSPLIIGILILGFGTSMPEIVVSTLASLADKTPIAIGNAIGSNIANIGLVIGFTAIIRPIKVSKNVLFKDFIFLIAISTLLVIMLVNYEISRLEGLLLLFIFCFIMGYKFLYAKKHSKAIDNSTPKVSELSLRKSIIYIVLGLVILVISAQLLIFGASRIGLYFGMSELAVGLTIIAIGTSLPELATSAVAAYKQHHELALGNIIGSNIFNTLIVIGIAVCISPAKLQSVVLYRDAAYMMVLTLGLFIFALLSKNKINRLQGVVFLISYFVYIGSLFWK